MGIYEEGKTREQAELIRKGLIAGIIILLVIMVCDYFFSPIFLPFVFSIYGSLFLCSVVLLYLLRIKKHPVPIIYTTVFLCAIAAIFLHQQTGLMEDYGDLGIPILISAATFLVGWGGGIFITTFSSLFYALLVYLEYFQIIPSHSISGIPLYQRFKGTDILNLTVGRIILWFGLCIMTGVLYRLMDSKRKELAHSKEELVAWSEELSKRVEERTKELRETQEKLALSEKMSGLGRLSIGIAHEINNPLAIIMLNAQLLSKEVENFSPALLRGECSVFVDRILNASNRCRDIVGDLLDFSRGLHQVKLRLARADINNMIEEVIPLLDKEVKAKNIELIKNYAPHPLELICDSSKIKQVLFNVLLNALQSMPERGKLTINTVSEDENVKIEIIDTGCGIPEDDIRKLFDPFFTTKDRGIGMGLPIAYSMTEAHNGSIDIESEVGKGTKVTIKLPAKQE